jgi:hypothetical protein
MDMDCSLADWVGALASAGAFIAFVVLWRIDRAKAAADEIRQNKEYLRRMVASLKAEVEWGGDNMRRHEVAARQALAGAEAAEAQGRVVVDQPLKPGSVVITDATIYRAAALELGRLPPSILRELVAFYVLAADLARIVEMGGSGRAGYGTLLEIAPRLRFHVARVLATLKRYEDSGFDAGANLALTPEELFSMADDVGYDLRRVLREHAEI